MKTSFSILLSSIALTAPAQTNLLTFTNNSGVVFTDARVVKIEPDGVLFGFTNWQYTRVKFTNMPQTVQAWFGYDPQKASKENEERLARATAMATAARERAISEAKAAQFDAIGKWKGEFDLYQWDDSDLPKTEASRQSCKEIVAELNGISTVLEAGLSYNQFSDLLVAKILAVQKVKDLRGGDLPREFLRHAKDCLDAYGESKEWWDKKIEAEHPKLKAFDEYCMREYWSEADLELICCAGIAASNTNASTLLIPLMAKMIRNQQNAVSEGVLEMKGNFDQSVSYLTVEQISDLLKAALVVTNKPAIEGEVK